MSCLVCSRTTLSLFHCSNCKTPICQKCTGIDIESFTRLTQTAGIYSLCLNCNHSLRYNSIRRSTQVDSQPNYTLGFNTNVKDVIKDYNDFKLEMKKNVKESTERFMIFEARLKQLASQLIHYNTIDENTAKIKHLTRVVEEFEQKTRNNNIEIRGVPEIRNEDLIHIVSMIFIKINVSFSIDDIDYCRRVRTFDASKPRNIIVRFSSKLKKQFILSESRRLRWNTKDFQIAGPSKPVIIRAHLTVKNRNILRQTKKEARKKKYEFVWVSDGNIIVKKSRGSDIIVIKTVDDIVEL